MVAVDLDLHFDPICCVERWIVWISRKPGGNVCRTHGVSVFDWDWNWVSGAASLRKAEVSWGVLNCADQEPGGGIAENIQPVA